MTLCGKQKKVRHAPDLNLYEISGTTKFAQNHDSGMTRTMAGIMSAVGNAFSCMILKPVASMRKPPQALKSLIIAGVVSGKITPASRYSRIMITNWGMPTRETDLPSEQAKIMAVKKSRKDLAIRIEWSPLMPETRAP